MSKFLKKAFFYGFVIFIVANGSAFLLNYFLSKSEFYKPSFLINKYAQQKEFDYFILGSSRGLTTLNTQQIDDSLTLKGINLSMDDTGLDMHYLMLQHFFQSGYSAEYCILTLDKIDFKNSKEALSNNAYRFVPYASQDYVQNYYSAKESFPFVLSFSHVFPMFSFAYYNLELVFPSILSIVYPQRRYRFDKKGNYSYPSNLKVSQEGERIEKKGHSEIKIINSKLNEFLHVLHANNCKLIVYIAPYQKEAFDLKQADIAPFIIINHSNLITDYSDFYDTLHVNSKGRKKASDAFLDDFRVILEEN